MKINRTELLAALEKVKPGLANKEIIEQSTSFAFIDGKVVTYNDEVSVSCPVEGLDTSSVVLASELYKFLGRVTQDEIDVSKNENELVIRAGKFKANLVAQEEVRLPLQEIGEIEGWRKTPKKFLDGLKFCYSSCSKDMSRPVLTCLNVTDVGTVVASDGYRLTVYSLGESMPCDSFLLPATSAQILCRYDVKEVSRGDSWVHFKTDDDVVFSCRIYNDNYPKISHLLEVEGETIHFPKKLKSVIGRAEVFVNSDFDVDEEISIELEDKRMTVKAQTDYGRFREEIRSRYEGEPIKFNINPKFLSEIIDLERRCTLGENMMKFEGENWVHLVSLISVEDD